MLKKLSTFQILTAGLFISGLVPLLVVMLLSADAFVIGLIILAAVAAGAAYWLAQRIVGPARQLASITDSIRTAVDAETTAALTPHLKDLDAVGGGPDFATLASSFKQLVRVFQQRLDEYHSIYAMGRVIATKLDFEQTVLAVLDAVKQVVVFDAAEVSVLRGDRLVVEAWSGKEEYNNTTGRQYRVGRGPTGTIATTKTSVLVSTIQGTEEDLKRTLGYESLATGEFLARTTKVMINSFLGIPLVIEDRVIGTLTLVHRDPGRFTESDRRQLEKLAAQASIAIDNAIQVRQRETILKAQIQELRVEIDESRLNKEVEEITGSDYFQTLQNHAAKMRKRVYDRSARGKSKPAGEEAASGDLDTTPDGGN
jgi:GAF domain-containing protein